MRNSQRVIAALLGSFTMMVFAQTAPQVVTESAPGKVTMTGTVKATATIVGIEPSTRTIWIKDVKGKIVQIVVGEEARNFEQLKVGDRVAAEYSEAITVTLKKSGAPLSISESHAMERAPAGAKPGGMASREVTIMANVTAVNPQTSMITLKGPQGNSLDLAVRDPEQLKLIKKGDQMEVVYTEAIAISVEPLAK